MWPIKAGNMSNNGTRNDGRAIKVLVVEDDDINRKLLVVLLESERFIVLPSSDGIEALKVLEHEVVDVVISDILMPNMDGFKLCHRIRSEPKFKDLPFIFYTATHFSAGDRNMALEVGGDRFLAKPATAEMVVTAIKEVMEIPTPRQEHIHTLSENDVMREYSDSLVKKLEQRNIELADLAGRLEASQTEAKVVLDQINHIFENLDEVVFLFDAINQKILQISPACQKVYDRPQADFYTNAFLWRDTTYVDDLPIVEAAFVQLMNGVAQQWIMRVVRPDESLRWLQIKARATIGKSGKVETIEGIATDITEQKSLEEQIRQTQKLESLGTLSAGIAHDFNNILAIMIGNATLLQEGELDEKQRQKDLEIIIQAGFRGAGLVRQLLTFARKGELVFEDVVVNKVVEEVTKMINETFPKSITIVSHLKGSDQVITADSGQLHQVLINLCVNARDAMPDGGLLTIETRKVSGNIVRHIFASATAEEYIVIEVADSGIGMDVATKQRIFEPFFTTKEKSKGTGLGLATVFGIVQGHNGFIDVSSVVGSGTKFTVYLPAARTSDGDSTSKTTHEAERIGGSDTILLVEDEQELRELAQQMLQSNGYKIISASNGLAALTEYEAHHSEIALVLSDIDLPEMTGPEAFLRLRKFNPQLKMILVSGFIDPSRKAQLLEDGVKGFIQKPYTVDEMLKKIREVINA